MGLLQGGGWNLSLFQSHPWDPWSRPGRSREGESPAGGWGCQIQHRGHTDNLEALACWQKQRRGQGYPSQAPQRGRVATRQNRSGAGAQDSPQGQAGQLQCRGRGRVVLDQLCRLRPNTHRVSGPATTSFLGKLTGALGPTRR